jgi:copper chaperone
MDPIVLKVNGMTCGGCVKSVKRVVQAKTGVEPDVSLEAGEVRPPAGTDEAAAAEAITKAGFEVQAP